MGVSIRMTLEWLGSSWYHPKCPHVCSWHVEMKRTPLILSLTLLAAILSGCASRGNYLINRGGDLADVVQVQFLAGKGAVAKLEVTRLLHLGLGHYSDAGAAGLANRELATWRTSACTWGLLFGYHDERDTTRIGQFSGSYGWLFHEPGPGGFEEAAPLNQLDLLTVRGTLMLFLGIDLELKVGEFLDFVAGIFQFDPAGDDVDSADWVKHP